MTSFSGENSEVLFDRRRDNRYWSSSHQRLIVEKVCQPCEVMERLARNQAIPIRGLSIFKRPSITKEEGIRDRRNQIGSAVAKAKKNTDTK
jgi:hypothetical protein